MGNENLDRIMPEINMMESIAVPNAESFEYIGPADRLCNEAFDKGENPAVLLEFDDCYIITSGFHESAGHRKDRTPHTIIIKGRPTRINKSLLNDVEGG